MVWGSSSRDRGTFPKSFAELAKQGPIGVFVHDSGSASHILSWLMSMQADSVHSTRVFAAGPAKKMFTAAGIDLVENADELVRGTSWVVVGTGWPNDREKGLMNSCARSGIPVVAVLDHWINYTLRFEELAPSERPYAVVVSDSEALVIARRDLPWARAVQWDNALLARFEKEFYSSRRRANCALWLNEPVQADGRLADPLTLDTVRTRIREQLTHAVRRFGLTQITIRQHPSLAAPMASNEGIVAVLEGLPVSWEVSPSDRSLAEDVAAASLVLGINTYGLFLSSHYNPNTYSLATALGYRNYIPSVYVQEWPNM